MKLFAILATAQATHWIHPEVVAANRALGIPMDSLPGECWMMCTVDAARESIRCEKHEEGSIEKEQCFADAESNFYQCMKVDGCIVADGTCVIRCIPTLEEDIAQCEGDYENGLLTDLEFVVCINTVSVSIQNTNIIPFSFTF